MSGYLAGIIAILSINVIFAYGIFLAVASGQLNLGGAGFQAVGAYAAGWLSYTLGLPVAVTLLAGAVVAGIVGVALAFPILRTRGVYLVLATFAFAEVVAGLILNTDALGGAMGMSVPGYVEWQVPMVGAIVVALLVFYLMSTRFGLTLRAIHDDEDVSDLMGVSIRNVKVAAFGIGAALAGLSGAFYAHNFGYIEAQGFNAMVSIYVLLYVLLGGTQTAWGPLVGAAFFTLLPEVLREVLPAMKDFFTTLFGGVPDGSRPDESWRFVILGVLAVGFMAIRPEGLITRTMVERLSFRRPASRLKEATE